MCQYGHLAIRNQIMAARGNFLVWRTLFKYFQWFHPHWWVDVTMITLQDLFPQTAIISRVCCSLFVAGSCIVRSPHPTLIISGVCSLQCIEGLYCAPIISGLCWSLPRALSNFYRTLLHQLCHDLRFDIKKMCKKNQVHSMLGLVRANILQIITTVTRWRAGKHILNRGKPSHISLQVWEITVEVKDFYQYVMILIIKTLTILFLVHNSLKMSLNIRSGQK